jgi:hypothetical protein
MAKATNFRSETFFVREFGVLFQKLLESTFSKFEAKRVLKGLKNKKMSYIKWSS